MNEELWEELWRRLDVVFERVVDDLQAGNPALSPNKGHARTDYRPFVAWLSMYRFYDPARSEDIAVSVDVNQENGEYVLSADIADGEGMVFAEGPERRVGVQEAGARCTHGFVDDVRSFLDDQMPLMRLHLG